MKVLFLVSRFPFPIEKGDKLRAFHQIKCLSKDHEVILCALCDSDFRQEWLEQVRPWCSKVYTIRLSFLNRVAGLLKAFFQGLPLQVGYFYNEEASRTIHEIISEDKPDHIVCQLVRMSEYLRGIKTIPVTLDYMDALSAGTRRRKEISSFPMSWLLGMEQRRLLRYEKLIFDDFSSKWIISEQDRNEIAHPEHLKIKVMPNGVDTDFFHAVTADKKYDLLFTGNMAYPPNVDGAVFLVEEILPLVRKRFPSVRVLVAGASPVNRVLRLRSPAVEVSGWVQDIRPCYSSSKIFVAPMRIGTGLQNKILEAMAMELPSVISPLANQAIQATPGKCVLVAEHAQAYADHICRLLEDGNYAREVGSAALAFVKEHYNWENLCKGMLK